MVDLEIRVDHERNKFLMTKVSFDWLSQTRIKFVRWFFGDTLVASQRNVILLKIFSSLNMLRKVRWNNWCWTVLKRLNRSLRMMLNTNISKISLSFLEVNCWTILSIMVSILSIYCLKYELYRVTIIVNILDWINVILSIITCWVSRWIVWDTILIYYDILKNCSEYGMQRT